MDIGSLLLLYLDPSTRPKMLFKVMQRKEVTHSNGSYERKSRRWAQLIIWDKMKVPLQSDAPEESDFWTAWQLFPLDGDQTCHSKDWVDDRVGVELLYNSVKTEVRQLEIRRVRRQNVVEKPGGGGPWGPWWVGVQRSCWQDVVEKASTQQKAEPLGLRLSSPGERERHNADGHKSGGQYIAVMFGLQLPLTIKPWITFSNPYNKVRGIYFSKEVFALVCLFIVSLWCCVYM